MGDEVTFLQLTERDKSLQRNGMFGVLRENTARQTQLLKGSAAMRTVTALAVAAVAAFAAPASATEIKLAQVWPKMSCHAAASMGFAVVGVNVDGDGNSIPYSAQGAIGEVTAGCDVRLDNVIVGPFGSFALGDEDRWVIGIRAGYMTSPDVMIFGKGGYVTAGTDGLSQRLDGYMLGGGVETMITKMLGIRLEADHTRFNGESLGGHQGEADPSETQVKTGVVIKF